MEEAGTAAFGAHAPPPVRRTCRALAARLPAHGPLRWLTFLLRRLAGASLAGPLDVILFGHQRARLYPARNLCEKRVYATPQLWDADERELLAAHIHAGSGPFHFVDVGANVGLYTLFVREICQRAQRPLVAIAIEPSALLRGRLCDNLALNRAEEVAVVAEAVASEVGQVRLAHAVDNLGQTSVVADGPGDVVSARPLLDIVMRFPLPALDALKIDIEGGEHAVLEHFFATATQDLRPRMIITETATPEQSTAQAALMSANGYRVLVTTRLNSVYVNG
ncbi:MAG: FkbM family methyltransferase [Gammaproteobacteria bacterium]|nr:FkbM family methyltransferase [Gammaproteobacteria bacterium]